MSTAPALHPAGEASLRQLLARIHQHWMAEALRHVGPVTGPGAGFRDRWAALLYLTDRFEQAYCLEREALDQLRGRLTPDAEARLAAEARAIDDLRATFEWLQRQGDLALRAAAIARSLLLALRRWWGEIERAVDGLRYGELSPESRDLLRELHAALIQETAHDLPVYASVSVREPS